MLCTCAWREGEVRMYTTRRTVAMCEARGAPSHAKECDTSCGLLGTIYIYWM